MRTSKPIATISYNTQEFLVQKLEELIKSHKISDYVFINHFAEEDEKKNHIHLWIKPNKLLDTMDVQKYLMELDPKNPTKPLKCIDFHLSKVDDFILYGQHYAPYLASKGESREYHYTKDDFVYYDEDSFDDLYNHAFKGSEWAKRNQILEALRDNKIEPSELILNGTLPLNMACSVNTLTNMMHRSGLDRGAHKNHEEQLDK